MRTLQDILTDLPFADLPPAWQDYDLVTFSSKKYLWDYQQQALEFALKALWKYYEDFRDFTEGESEATNEERKTHLWQWYRDNGLEENLDISLRNLKRDVRALLEEYYPVEDERIPYRHFINRMSFWMATGSGKSLVLIKLIELLWRLMLRGEIPEHPVLVLTARDDLLDQLKAHVEEFNSGSTDFRIHLEDLKAYPEHQYMSLPLVGEHEITVFFYRADNLSDEQKERIVDFRNYENNGRWYVLLDEAHKGDKEESKRQHIYSILSRNGFLFNFSATFTDPRDILTTVYNFNLSEFVRAGYGKHIVILKQENRTFRDKEDYTGAEKQRVVLKALLMLAYVRKAQEALPLDVPAYHRPLMLTLVNSVNTEDADLKLFFRELERIGQGKIDESVWKQAREELWAELDEGPELLFEGDRFRADRELFESITPAELLYLVYNAPAPGEIEVLLRPSNRQEIAFKLKSAEEPFALIRIGDISEWLRTELEGYEVIEGYEDEGFFQRLNENDSPINILMGSRTFYEGWDSNRPNVITYINIGTGTEARKFILQSVGRGVRIEPLSGKRRRLLYLYNAGEIDQATFDALKNHAPVLETLFIFGTNRNTLQTVIQQLDREKRREDEHEIALAVNDDAIDKRLLLIPVYREAGHTILEDRKPRKFEIAQEELNLLRQYVDHLGDPRLLVCRHGASPSDITLLTRCLDSPEDYFNTYNGRRYGQLSILLSRLFSYFKVIPLEADGLKPLENEICHFRHIKVLLKDISELKEKIQQVQSYRDPTEEQDKLIQDLQRGQISPEEFRRRYDELSRRSPREFFEHEEKQLQIRHIASHYYLPVLLSENERIDWIRHVIRHPSEVEFLNKLEQYLEQPDNALASLDWWAFSKIDETLDEVYIPYYDPRSNRIRRFLPDFIFWLQKGNEYAIVFVDPKGMQQTDYQHKVDGFREIFLDDAGRSRTFGYRNMTVRVHLLLYTRDRNRAPEAYRECWFDSLDAIPACLGSI
ncbi:DEAD/DEAH box helicase family protein [Hydrogenivirga sp. 128-5-R1-1]|uniref:DEAD/DEAH box helicase family protein n=1 Tax=Hydrogenivirga sp. 128-5-R1-1 TaxID=392423 RepID=UPI00015F3371|nr:DEAD/DEAH box helicase family protein [Hydrogenivirga sp. 128-5-R1-1]EDP74830.1 type III restriction enzyme R protein [Hydrogenivirga sp. 128-5-R1-1]